jgi:hypothetical protein
VFTDLAVATRTAPGRDQRIAVLADRHDLHVIVRWPNIPTTWRVLDRMDSTTPRHRAGRTGRRCGPTLEDLPELSIWDAFLAERA